MPISASVLSTYINTYTIALVYRSTTILLSTPISVNVEDYLDNIVEFKLTIINS